MAKPLRQPYQPGVRGWRKIRHRHTTEAIIGAVTGTLRRPTGLLLGRYDRAGMLQYVGRSPMLAARASSDVGVLLQPGALDHTWRGRTFSAGWGTRETLGVTLVEPEQVAEISADTSMEDGRWRHAVRFVRLRADVSPTDVPEFGAGNEPADG
ncbi:ATP-dependent DNA ligase [Streptomyces sp. NPDC093595]|uniref:ATP-dependent DNA ligase n=1 Tax=Streptomyces sp. NPDC093595 TaxID=3366045 RepID=UPI00380DEBBE